MTNKHQINLMAGTRNNTSYMTTREIADYLAKQREKGWPGSISIHNRALGAKPKKTKSEVREEHETLAASLG